MRKTKLVITFAFLIIVSWSVIAKIIDSIGKVPVSKILFVIGSLLVIIYLLINKVLIDRNKKIEDKIKVEDEINKDTLN
jgi:hypothetical protein